MRQAVERCGIPPCQPAALGWLGRLRAMLFGSRDRRQLIALRHCSPHFLRDIGLSENPEINRLLQDHHLRR
jgi:hypothetical protein